jgi:hypothetical protein
MQRVAVAFNAAQADPEHDAVETGVRDQKIAAAAEDEQRETFVPRKAKGFQNVFFARRFGEPARGAAYAQRRIRSQRNMFTELHAIQRVTDLAASKPHKLQ